MTTPKEITTPISDLMIKCPVPPRHMAIGSGVGREIFQIECHISNISVSQEMSYFVRLCHCLYCKSDCEIVLLYFAL